MPFFIIRQIKNMDIRTFSAQENKSKSITNPILLSMTSLSPIFHVQHAVQSQFLTYIVFPDECVFHFSGLTNSQYTPTFEDQEIHEKFNVLSSAAKI